MDIYGTNVFGEIHSFPRAWEEWSQWHSENSLVCGYCGTHVFPDTDGDYPSQCPNCYRNISKTAGSDGLNPGDLIEVCERCLGCGTQHPCGEDTCEHDFGFVLEAPAAGNVLSRFATGDRPVPVNRIVAMKWAGWIPEEIETIYDEWMSQHRPGWDIPPDFYDDY